MESVPWVLLVCRLIALFWAIDYLWGFSLEDGPGKAILSILVILSFIFS